MAYRVANAAEEAVAEELAFSRVVYNSCT